MVFRLNRWLPSNSAALNRRALIHDKMLNFAWLQLKATVSICHNRQCICCENTSFHLIDDFIAIRRIACKCAAGDRWGARPSSTDIDYIVPCLTRNRDISINQIELHLVGRLACSARIFADEFPWMNDIDNLIKIGTQRALAKLTLAAFDIVYSLHAQHWPR